ncbi:Threonine efflux protein, partial [Pseudomonas sp. FEN]
EFPIPERIYRPGEHSLSRRGRPRPGFRREHPPERALRPAHRCDHRPRHRRRDLGTRALHAARGRRADAQRALAVERRQADRWRLYPVPGHQPAAQQSTNGARGFRPSRRRPPAAEHCQGIHDGFSDQRHQPQGHVVLPGDLHHRGQRLDSTENPGAVWPVDVWRECTVVHPGQPAVFQRTGTPGVSEDGPLVRTQHGRSADSVCRTPDDVAI